MPIYEYRCEQGHTFEVLQRMSDDPISTCQTCSAPVNRVFHPVAVHFKGSGFYNTDYGTRKRSRELKEGAESNGKPASEDGASKSGGEPKPAGESKSTETKSTSAPAKSSTASD